MLTEPRFADVEVWMNFYLCMCSKSLQLCLTLCDPMDCSGPGSSVHEISQARILKWAAMTSSRGSSRSRGWTGVSSVQFSRSVMSDFVTPWTASCQASPSITSSLVSLSLALAGEVFITTATYLRSYSSDSLLLSFSQALYWGRVSEPQHILVISKELGGGEGVLRTVGFGAASLASHHS